MTGTLITPEIQITSTVSPSLSITESRDITQPQLVEEFEEGWENNWTITDPEFLEVINDGNPALQFNVNETGDTWISTKTRVPLSSGTSIEFKANVNEQGPDSVIIFNWKLLEEPTDPMIKAGSIHININNKETFFQTLRKTGNDIKQISCPPIPYPGSGFHTYEIQITEVLGAIFLVDSNIKCEVNDPIYIGVNGQMGQIQFSGQGQIDNLIVQGP
jgi:hypothetical protein